MPGKTSLLKSLRTLHLYLGVFIAPALCFFAFTGALQTFSLHETTRGSSYRPPRWAAVLAQLHKKQTVHLPPPRTAPAETPQPRTSSASPAATTAPFARPKDPPVPAAAPTGAPGAGHALPMKIFFLVVSLGLLTSTGSGIYMAYRYNRRPAVITALLLAGAVVPIALLFA